MKTTTDKCDFKFKVKTIIINYNEANNLIKGNNFECIYGY